MAGKAPKKKEKRPWVVTPMGRINYPFLDRVDSGRTYSDDKYHTDLLFPKATWKEDGKALRTAVILEARKFFKDDTLLLKDFKHPFKDGDDKDPGQEASKPYKGMVYITPKAQADFPPGLVDALKNKMTEDAMKSVKSGDYGRCVVDAYPYTQSGGGITLGLKTFQFIKPGEPFGVSGSQAAVNMLDELPDDILADLNLDGDDEDDDASEDGDEF